MATRSKEDIARDVELTRLAAKRAFKNAVDIWSGKNAVASAWRSTRRAYLRTQDKIADTVYAADTVVQENIYVSAGIAAGLGTILGYFLTSKPRKRGRG